MSGIHHRMGLIKDKSGSEFHQTVGPATEKTQVPKVLRRNSR